MLNLNRPLEGLRGAEYNPRKITDADRALLADSIRALGIVKPLIVRGDLLVAGHQRTSVLRELGFTHAPVYELPCATTVYDEIRFNQLHNGTDMDSGTENARITGPLTPGWQVVEGARITGNFRDRLGNVRNSLAPLITKYGSWGGVVATQSGEVIHCAQYALTAGAMRVPCTVYAIPDSMAGVAREYLGARYGVFSYDHLQRETFVQTYAQLPRLRLNSRTGKNDSSRSMLYDKYVIPWLEQNPTARVLDFGSGRGDYPAALRRRGYAVTDIEFYRRVTEVSSVKAESFDMIDLRAVRKMHANLVRELEEHGRFDAVVCDSVFNSVDSLAAEHAVATCLNTFAKVGGLVFSSGRNLEEIAIRDKLTRGDCRRRRVEFLDEHNMTALYRNGRWFYQKFHDPEGAERLSTDYGMKVEHHERATATYSWRITARKVADLPEAQVVEAVRYEWGLPYPGGQTLGGADDVLDALGVERGR